MAAIFNDPSAYGPGATFTIPAEKLNAAAAGISAINTMAAAATSATVCALAYCKCPRSFEILFLYSFRSCSPACFPCAKLFGCCSSD